MAKANRKTTKKEKVAENYRHDEQEALLRPDIGLQAQFKKKKAPKTYRYDPSLDPELSWDINADREHAESLIARILETSDLNEAKTAAEALKKKLELILEGEGYPNKDNPEKSYGYDIFIRWKPIEEQPVGWNPDLNDGVRLNIRPFLTVPDVGKKGAGCLRDKPNINWNKDRGKDVESAPWFHLFEGDRINDHHLSLAEKKKARVKQ